jgi:hypothetical protein
VALAGVLPCSCADGQEARTQAAMDLRGAIAQCDQSHPRAQGNYQAGLNCLEPARRRLLLADGIHPGLVNYFLAQSRVNASDVDRGAISVPEAQLRDARAEREMQEATLRRRNEWRASQSPPAPMVLQQAAPLPTPQIQGPQFTTCSPMRNSVHCVTR